MLTWSVGPPRRNRAFAQYSLIGGLASATGGLAAGLGTNLGRSQGFFVLYGLIGIITGLLPLLLSDGVEGETGANVPTWPPIHRRRGAQDDLRPSALSRVPKPPWRPQVEGSAVGDELQQIALGVAEVDAPAVSPGAVPSRGAADQRDP